MTVGMDFGTASPPEVADAIIAALADGTDEVPTDAVARAMYEQWTKDPRAAQEQAAGMAV